VSEIHNMDAENLLGRDVSIPTEWNADVYLKQKTVLVTGAGGSIGSELAIQIAQHQPRRLILLGHGENSIQSTEMKLQHVCTNGLDMQTVIADVQDSEHIGHIFRLYQPEVVFHAAAHKHVPLMEHNEIAAIKNNVLGTKTLIDAACQYGVERFVFISTDKAVYPINVMGMTKRIGEMLVQRAARAGTARFSVVRFGNVLESRGSVIPIFKRQIEEGGPVTVTHPDMIRYFMTIPEAVHLVLEAGEMSQGGEIFVLDMGKPIRIIDLARSLIQLSGLEPDRDIPIVFTGMRPGEKLQETLFYVNESISPSAHPRIFKASPIPLDIIQFVRDLQELESNLFGGRDQLRTILKRMINEAE
jgi:FlaA1/EpsC-like NDP-sugar epimerase